MTTLLVHAELPSCDECMKWQHDSKWRIVERRGFGPDGAKGPVPRGAMPLPCGICPKGPVPREKELTAKNWRAFRTYMEIKAGAPMPEDAIVRRNCGLIRWVEDCIEREQAGASVHILNALPMLVKRGA